MQTVPPYETQSTLRFPRHHASEQLGGSRELVFFTAFLNLTIHGHGTLTGRGWYSSFTWSGPLIGNSWTSQLANGQRTVVSGARRELRPNREATEGTPARSDSLMLPHFAGKAEFSPSFSTPLVLPLPYGKVFNEIPVISDGT